MIEFDKHLRYDKLYMGIARQFANMSHAVRAKVGCVVLFKDGTISPGWNGMPSGMDNCCEKTVEHPIDHDERHFQTMLLTRPEVSHAEENAIAKIAKSHHSSAGATAYVTLEPCMHCAKLLYSAGITRVVIGEMYRDHAGSEFLLARGIEVSFLL